MTQFATTRSMFRLLPGHVATPEGPGRETESFEVPLIVQSFTFTVSAAPDPVTAGDYEMIFVTPQSGTITVEFTAAGTETPDELATALALAASQTGGVANLYKFTVVGRVVTAMAKSYNINLATPTTAVPGATTLTPALLTAPSAPSLAFGRFYVYRTPQTSLAITGTPRGRYQAALPGATTTLALLRGVVGRPVNQTTLASNYAGSTDPDAYTAGTIGFGLLRGEVDVVVDPASATITDAIDQQVHVVIAAGVYSVIGSVAAVADGANTLRIDNAPTGNVLGRAVAVEETLAFGASLTNRSVRLKVSRTN